VLDVGVVSCAVGAHATLVPIELSGGDFPDQRLLVGDAAHAGFVADASARQGEEGGRARTWFWSSRSTSRNSYARFNAFSMKRSRRRHGNSKMRSDRLGFCCY
jgi:hypothetical protein